MRNARPALVLALPVLAFLSLAPPAAADEIEAALEAALEAYRAGDVALAREELDYAAILMGELKAEGLSGFLPEPFEGWTREEAETRSAAAFGGGVIAGALYRGAPGTVDIQMMAENQMVASMAALFANPALMSSMGTVRRIGRQRYVVTEDGDVQALVEGRIMVQISGDAPVEEKIAYLEAIDLEALAGF